MGSDRPDTLPAVDWRLQIFNRNMGVLQTTVAEIVTVKEHQGRLI